jgi:hypothetical protein
MFSHKVLSPAEWFRKARWDDQAKWLLKGFLPSRSTLYDFRDRLAPYLDSWHQQLIFWAKQEELTKANSGSLDGSTIAALASRHRLLGQSGLDRRLLLLQLAVFADSTPAVPPVAPALALLLVLQGELQRQLVALLSVLKDLGPLLPLLLHGVVPGLPAWLPRTVPGRRRVLRRYDKAQQRLTDRRQQLWDKPKPPSKKAHKAMARLKVSTSDPEAALGYDKEGTYRPLYTPQAVVATDAPLVLSFELEAINCDQGQLRPMMEKTKEQLGEHLDYVLCDPAYASNGDLLWCEQQGIEVYSQVGTPQSAQTVVQTAQAILAQCHAASEPKASVPVTAEQAANNQLVVPFAEQPVQASQPASAKAASQPQEAELAGVEPFAIGAAKLAAESRLALPMVVEQPALEGKAAKEEAGPLEELQRLLGEGKKFPKEAFEYRSEEEVYVCPAGERLERAFKQKEQRSGGVEAEVWVHRAQRQACQECPLRPCCTSGAVGRVVKRYVGEEAQERLAKKMEKEAAQERYKLRCRSVELGYADIKEHRGLRVFRSFGKKRARTQVGLVVLAYNALNICRALDRRAKAADRHTSAA